MLLLGEGRWFLSDGGSFIVSLFLASDPVSFLSLLFLLIILDAVINILLQVSAHLLRQIFEFKLVNITCLLSTQDFDNAFLLVDLQLRDCVSQNSLLSRGHWLVCLHLSGFSLNRLRMGVNWLLVVLHHLSLQVADLLLHLVNLFLSTFVLFRFVLRLLLLTWRRVLMRLAVVVALGTRWVVHYKLLSA